MSVKHLLLSETSYLAALREQRLGACTGEKMLCGMLLFQPGYATHSTKYCNLYCFQFSFKALGDYISLCWYIDTIVKRDDASY